MNTRRFLLFLTLTILCITGAEQASAFYNPGTGRWLSKDPINEAGGVNLYSACENNCINRYDALGLSDQDGIGPVEVGPTSQIGPVDIGFAWLFGILPPNATLGFSPDSYMGIAVRNSRFTEIDRQRVRARMRAYCASSDGKGDVPDIPLGGETGPFSNDPNYTPRFLPYVAGFIQGVTVGNRPGEFTGSWTSGYVRILPNQLLKCCAKRVKVHFHAVNVSGLESTSHGPPDQNNQYPPSWLRANRFGIDGLMHDISQVYDWDETISFGSLD